MEKISRTVPLTGWPKTTEPYSVTVLEAGSVESRCWQGQLPLQPVQVNPSLLPPPAGSPTFSFACGSIIPVSASVSSHDHIFLVSAFVQIFLL